MGYNAPLGEPEILSEDLDKAEDEMETYDNLASTSKSYLSQVRAVFLECVVLVWVIELLP